MKVQVRTFGVTYGWSSPGYYSGPATYSRWIGDKYEYYGGVVLTDRENAPELDAKTAFRAMRRAIRIGFQSKIE